MTAKKLAVVEQKVCVACGACEAVCPRGAIAVFRGCYAQVDTAACVGCGICAKSCPGECISVRNREEQA